MALVYGLGFPPFRGVFRYLDSVGIGNFVEMARLPRLRCNVPSSSTIASMAEKAKAFTTLNKQVLCNPHLERNSKMNSSCC
ncbi:hypothetical protein OK016_09370 [Vibrio chagasii]|nr:hypothetical protein [Vibrio chagasii]